MPVSGYSRIPGVRIRSPTARPFQNPLASDLLDVSSVWRLVCSLRIMCSIFIMGTQWAYRTGRGFALRFENKRSSFYNSILFLRGAFYM